MYKMIKSSALMAMLTAVAACSSAKRYDANVTNYESAGNLETTHNIGCVSPSELINKYTPPDLYQGMVQCIKTEKEINAIYLFSLAGTYTHYDAQRVSDNTAHQAHSVLLMNALNAVSEAEKKQLFTSLKNTLENPDKLPEVCDAINKIGPPNYHPTYMIQHGMGSFSGSSSNDGLINNFNSLSAWEGALNEYLHCPKN